MADKDLVTIEPEFEKLCPALQKEEFDRLEANIIADGCREPIVCWDFIIVDGHNRFKICKKHGTSFDIVHKNFVDDDEAKDWIINNQLGRRNITAEQRKYLIGRLYIQQKQAEKLAAVEEGLEVDKKSPPDKQGAGKSGQKKANVRAIAKSQRVSKTQVEVAAKYAAAVDQLKNGVRAAVLSREVKTTDADVKALAELPQEEQVKVVAEAKKTGKRVSAILPPKPQKPSKKHLKFDDAPLLEHLKQVTQWMDKRFRAYEDAKDSKTYHTAIMHNLRVARENYDEWRKRTA